MAALARVLICLGRLVPWYLHELLSRVAMSRYSARLPSLLKRSMVPISPASSEVQIAPYPGMDRNSLAIVDVSATSAVLTSNALIVSSSSKIRLRSEEHTSELQS